MFRFSEKSGVHGFSGLHGTSGVYGNSGVYKVSGFNPLDLDPYLLFDAQTSMIGTLENPTLDLDPSKQDTLDVITATRAGSATFVNISGQIETAQPNTVRVDNSLGYPAILVEPSATNLVDNSNSFTENVDLTKTTGIDAPDGTNTASKISGILSSSSSDMAYSIASTVTSSTQVTGSIYVRGIAGEVVVLRIKRYTGGAYVASGPQTVTLTGDWQRVEGLTMTLGADNTNAAVSIRKESGSTADSVDLWGGQIESGSVSTSYIPTSGSTVTRAKDDLSIDPDSTNLVTHSDFSGGWQEYLINSSAGSGYSLNASRVITSTGANAAYYIPVPTTNGATYTASIWARRVSGSGGCNIIYLSSPTAKQSISLTTEWQKFTATFTGKSGGGDVNFGVDIVTSGDSIEIAMPQVELGSSPTGFISTSGAAASRTAFTDFFNGSEGTFYVETTIAQPEKQYAILRGGSTNQLFIYSNNDTNHLFYDGNPTTSFGLVTANQFSRFALSYKSGNITASLNGSQNTGTPSGLLASSTKLEIGTGYNPDFNGHLKRVLFWPYHSDSL